MPGHFLFEPALGIISNSPQYYSLHLSFFFSVSFVFFIYRFSFFLLTNRIYILFFFLFYHLFLTLISVIHSVVGVLLLEELIFSLV